MLEIIADSESSIDMTNDIISNTKYTQTCTTYQQPKDETEILQHFREEQKLALILPVQFGED